MTFPIYFFIYFVIVYHVVVMWHIGSDIHGIYKELKRRNDKDGV